MRTKTDTVKNVIILQDLAVLEGWCTCNALRLVVVDVS